MPKSEGREWLILLSLWLLTFSIASQFLVIVPILSDIGKALNVEESWQGTLVSIYGILSAIFSLIAGPISDRLGRRAVLLIGTAIMSVALLLHPVATTFPVLLGMRALAGVASGFLSGASVAYVGDYFPYERRGWANGVIMSGFAAGQILGIPGGTVLAGNFGFAAPFVVFGALLLVVMALLWFFVPQPNVPLESKLTVHVALGKFASLLKHADTRAAAISSVFMFFSVSSFVTFMPSWLEHTFGVSKAQIASMYLVGGLAAVIGNPVAGRLSDRHGRRGIILTACVAFALIQVSTTFIMVRFEMAYLLFFLAMATASMRASPLQSMFTQIVEPERRGTLLGLTNSCGSIGFAFGAAFSGFVYTHLGFVHCTFMAATATLVTAAIIWRYLPEPAGEPVPAKS